MRGADFLRPARRPRRPPAATEKKKDVDPGNPRQGTFQTRKVPIPGVEGGQAKVTTTVHQTESYEGDRGLPQGAGKSRRVFCSRNRG